MSVLKWLIGVHKKDIAKRDKRRGLKPKGKQPLKPERYEVTLHNGRKIQFGE
jgi:hypothetical protein